jgi:hypothetical protein
VLAFLEKKSRQRKTAHFHLSSSFMYFKKTSPVKFISIARDLPMVLVSRWVPPAPGIVPMVISGWGRFHKSGWAVIYGQNFTRVNFKLINVSLFLFLGATES